MLQPLLKRIGTVAGSIFLLIITALIGWLAWLSWQQYVEQQQYEQVRAEGQHVTVKAEQVDRKNRSWTDQLGNIVYLTFTYQHKPYTLRYKATAWINEGDRVTLFYHPGLDVFRQPRSHSFFKENSNHSRLIRFTIISTWNDGRKWLAAAIGLTGVFVLLLSGLLATLTGLPLIRTAGRAVFMVMLLAGAVCLTYNTWQYYRYYNQLKSGAREETVQVLSTNHRNMNSDHGWYTFEATVQYDRQERVIPIAKADYKILKPGAPLQVYYNSRLNDMMSVNHTPDHLNLVATLFIWLILLFFVRQQWLKK